MQLITIKGRIFGYCIWIHTHIHIHTHTHTHTYTRTHTTVHLNSKKMQKIQPFEGSHVFLHLNFQYLYSLKTQEVWRANDFCKCISIKITTNLISNLLLVQWSRLSHTYHFFTLRLWKIKPSLYLSKTPLISRAANILKNIPMKLIGTST